MVLSADIQKLERSFVPADFKVTTWELLEPFFKNLAERSLNSREDLEQWMKDMSEVEAVVSEDACWRQIKMTCDTTDTVAREDIKCIVQIGFFEENASVIADNGCCKTNE